MKFKRGDTVKLIYIDKDGIDEELKLDQEYVINLVDVSTLPYRITNNNDWVYEFQLELVKIAPKKMTVAEVIKELGYDIEIIK